MPDVTCMGILVADVIVRPLDEWPERGRLALVDSIGLRSGGLAHTTGIALAKLGVDTAVRGPGGTKPFGGFFFLAPLGYGVRPPALRGAGGAPSPTRAGGAPLGGGGLLH